MIITLSCEPHEAEKDGAHGLPARLVRCLKALRKVGAVRAQTVSSGCRSPLSSTMCSRMSAAVTGHGGGGHAVLGILVCARSMRRGSRRYARSRQCYRNFAAQGINVYGVAMIETTSLAGAGIGIERECIIIRLSYLPFLPSQWKRKPRA